MTNPKTVLYVCVHNSGRSQMAEAMTTALAKEAGLPVIGESAGTVGGTKLNPNAVLAMEEIGIPMTGQFPKIMTQEMVSRADKIISMGCGVDADACPAKFILTEDWGLDDPAGQDLDKAREIRDDIHARVKNLLSGFEKP